ncbi:MAG: immunoglobulin-like domain-containing protein, partial [Patescibacteria group bacterium]
STTTSTTTPDTEAPVITLNGNNPATVNVGDIYTDLGASVTDNVNNNLGYTISLNGATSTDPSSLFLDTGISSTNTLTFFATDQAGNTGTATRTVLVEDPASTTSTATSTTP